MVEVQSGIPIPEKNVALGRKRGRGKWQILLNSMKEGDSIDVPEVNYNSIYVAACRLKIKLKSHRLGNEVVRIWRISNDG